MITFLILMLLAASFIGFWSERHALKASTQSVIASGYMLVVVFVMFSGFMP